MTFLRALLAFLPGIGIGLAAAHLLWPERGLRAWLLKVFLAPGLGLGIDSCLQFLWIMFFSPAATGFLWLEAALAAGLAAAAWRRPGLPPLPVPPAPPPNRRGRAVQISAGIILAIVLLAAMLHIGGEVLAHPNGNFDAYATWNLRARAIYLSPTEAWKAAFSPELSWKMHADYPLLWPLTLLRAWQALGGMASQAGQILTTLFGLACAGLLFAGLYYLNGFLAAALGTIVLTGMPWFQTYNALQQADGPLAYFYLAAMVLIVLHTRRGQPGLLALAGLASGLTAWTKNEGLVFLIAAAVTVWIGQFQAVRKSRQDHPGKASLRGLRPFLGGLAIPLAAVLLFKVSLAPPGDLISGQSLAEMLAKTLDPSRWGIILGAILQTLPQLGGWSWPAVWILPLGLLLVGQAKSWLGSLIWLIPGLTLLGYIGVYLITPYDLAWHLQYSLDRLVFHLVVPGMFFITHTRWGPKGSFGAEPT